MNRLFGVSKPKSYDYIDEDSDITDISDDIIDSESANIPQLALDILEDDLNLYIVVPIAGVELDDIDLSIDKTVLSIRGDRKKPYIYGIDGIKSRNSEVIWSNFMRNIILPENLNFDKINAIMENNLLTITIPKLEFSVKKVKINPN